MSASRHRACLLGVAWPAAKRRLRAACAEARLRRPAAQVVFATETLAAGINMPARTTVLSTISRRRNAGHTPLQHNELLQMAGRAGRRGYDTAGAPRAPSRAPRRRMQARADPGRVRVAATACLGCVLTRSISARVPRSLRSAGGVAKSTERCRRMDARAAAPVAAGPCCQARQPAAVHAGVRALQVRALRLRALLAARQRVAAGPPGGGRLLIIRESGFGRACGPAPRPAHDAPGPRIPAAGPRLTARCAARPGHCVIVQSRWEEAAQAAALLAAGPEPLRSQFGVGFGTALNLLATRSLDEARAFVQRSFANYLGAPRPALPPPPGVSAPAAQQRHCINSSVLKYVEVSWNVHTTN